MSFYVSPVSPGNGRAMAEVKRLLEQEGLALDGNLEYTCCVFDDEDDRAVATGSCFGDTLRCFAVDHERRGEGLLNLAAGHLIAWEAARGVTRLFLYTKCSSAKFFASLGFHEIARAEDALVFMENRRDGFSGYLAGLAESAGTRGRSAAVVMNANPFTLGHQYLAERAAAENDLVHIFVLSEDRSLFPFAARRALVEAGTAHLRNVVLHDSGPYIISAATFPSYFLKDTPAVIEGHARLDLAVFRRIASALSVTRRYVGEEPKSLVTGLYNRIMAEELPKYGIECAVVPRLTRNGAAVSASDVRAAVQRGDWSAVEDMVPETTLAYLRSPEAAGVVERIRAAGNVAHY